MNCGRNTVVNTTCPSTTTTTTTGWFVDPASSIIPEVVTQEISFFGRNCLGTVYTGLSYWGKNSPGPRLSRNTTCFVCRMHGIPNRLTILKRVVVKIKRILNFPANFPGNFPRDLLGGFKRKVARERKLNFRPYVILELATKMFSHAFILQRRQQPTDGSLSTSLYTCGKFLKSMGISFRHSLPLCVCLRNACKFAQVLEKESKQFLPKCSY